ATNENAHTTKIPKRALVFSLFNMARTTTSRTKANNAEKTPAKSMLILNS
ncbi:hypothetical protein ISN45_At02g029380, partial [Arabidopsis thaliana x Arabidopsis arenosa]